jgi:hypothetical protein
VPVRTRQHADHGRVRDGRCTHAWSDKRLGSHTRCDGARRLPSSGTRRRYGTVLRVFIGKKKMHRISTIYWNQGE